MKFDFDKFEDADFSVRTKDIPVPELKEFFPEGEDPVWVVKCLTAPEMAEIKNHVTQIQKLDEAVQEFFEGRLGKEFYKALRKQLGLPNEDDDVLDDVVFRKMVLSLGSIPRCPESIAVKMMNVRSLTFKRLTDEILFLTGEGYTLGG